MTNPDKSPAGVDGRDADKASEAQLAGGQKQKKRQFGALRGLISLDAEFFEPLPESELTAWE